MSSIKQPLTERPTNIAMSPSEDVKSKNVFADLKASEVNAQKQTYVSPSDNILSPTSKKLNEIKGKRFASGKPQSLFAKTVSRQGMKSEERLSETSPRKTAMRLGAKILIGHAQRVGKGSWRGL